MSVGGRRSLKNSYIDELPGGVGVLWISSDRDDQMGAKIKAQKILLGFKQNEKKPMLNFQAIKISRKH